MPRPLEGSLDNLENMQFDILNPEFKEICIELIQNNKFKPVVKTINNRPLTGYMLLGLALEYVDCLNRQETPIVMHCFERVVSIESERFVEQLYDETITMIN